MRSKGCGARGLKDQCSSVGSVNGNPDPRPQTPNPRPHTHMSLSARQYSLTLPVPSYLCASTNA
eukprot:824220-Rhodomonas_salina.2